MMGKDTPFIESLPDSSFSASSYDSCCPPKYAKSSSDRAWAWGTPFNEDEYLQIDLEKPRPITSISTWGRGEQVVTQWVTKYKFQFSNDGITFIDYEIGYEFEGNFDRNTELNHNLLAIEGSIIARYIRFVPTQYNIAKSMRVEVYGREDLALIQALPNSAFSASTYHSCCSPSKAKISQDAWTWGSPFNGGEYLQIDLTTNKQIASFSTLGRYHSDVTQWVTKYRVFYSNDGNTFIDVGIEFTGNWDKYTEVHHVLSNYIDDIIIARYLRFLPTQYHISKSMRVEVYETPQRYINGPLVDLLPASSFYALTHHNCCPPSFAKRSSYNGWSWDDPFYVDEYLQIDLLEKTQITSISTWGRNNVYVTQWVTKYTIKYSIDCVSWNDYNVEFSGNFDKDTEVNHNLLSYTGIIIARCVRFYPVEYNAAKSMRVEIYGTPLRDLNGAMVDLLPHSSISASSYHDSCPPSRAKRSIDAWCALSNDNAEDYLQIDLGIETQIISISSWGRKHYQQWVTKYKISYSNDGIIFIDYDNAFEFNGNNDQNTEINHILSKQNVVARYLRFIPITYYGHKSMRVEVYGSVLYKDVVKSLQDSAITASSSHASCGDAKPSAAKQSNYGWCTENNNNAADYLQINLGKQTQIQSIGTWGRYDYIERVTKYKISYSNDGNNFIEYGVEFEGNNDQNTAVNHILNTPINVQYIRFIPIEYYVHKSMRIAVYKCVSSECLETNDIYACDNTCNSNANCVDSKCECIVGYEGDGITTCNMAQQYNLKEVTGSLSLTNIDSNTGNVINFDVNTIENPENLYCGNPTTDKPIWAALLSLTQSTNILSTLNGIGYENAAENVQKYIQCTEMIYMIVTNVGPFRTLADFIEKSNLFISIMNDLDFTDSINVDSIINVLNNEIVRVLDKISIIDGIDTNIPFGYDSWNDYHSQNTESGHLFNPFNLQKDLGVMVGNQVCNKLFGKTIDDILDDLFNSDSVQNAITEYDANIRNFLNADVLGIFSDNDKQQLLNNDYYKTVSIASIIGMKFCAAKGLKGCITRSYGIIFNLNGEYKIFDQRSILYEIPAITLSLELIGFSHYDIMANINDITTNKMAFDIGIKATTLPIPNADKVYSVWNKLSGKISSIPFIGESQDILNGVDFLQNMMDNNVPIIDILIEGSQIRLSVKLSIIDASNGLLDCEGFRISLNIGGDALNVGMFAGIDYRTNDLNEIHYGSDWTHTAAKEGSQTFTEIYDILFNECLSQFDILFDTMTNTADEIADVAEDIIDSITSEIEKIPQTFTNFFDDTVVSGIKTLSNTADEAFDTAINDAEQTLDHVIKDAQQTLDNAVQAAAEHLTQELNNLVENINDNVIYPANSIINGANGKINSAKSSITGVKSACLDALDECETFDIAIYSKRVCVSHFVDVSFVCNLFDPVQSAVNALPTIPTVPSASINSAHKVDENVNQMDNLNDINLNVIGQNDDNKEFHLKFKNVQQLYIISVVIIMFILFCGCCCGYFIGIKKNQSWKYERIRVSTYSSSDTDNEQYSENRIY